MPDRFAEMNRLADLSAAILDEPGLLAGRQHAGVGAAEFLEIVGLEKGKYRFGGQSLINARPSERMVPPVVYLWNVANGEFPRLVTVRDRPLSAGRRAFRRRQEGEQSAEVVQKNALDDTLVRQVHGSPCAPLNADSNGKPPSP